MTTTNPTHAPRRRRTAAVLEPEDFLALPDSVAYELVDGKLVERQMGAESSAIAAAIIAVLRQFLRGKRLGYVFSSEASLQCFADAPKKLRRADVSFVRRGRFPNDEVPAGQILVVPDLVVEVVSPRDRAEDVHNKSVEYIAAGVPLVWVVYPKSRTVMIHRQPSAAAGPIGKLSENDAISGEDVIPGFTCGVAEFFEID